MNNAELIKALRHCTDETVEMCPPCPYFAWDKQKDNEGCMGEMMRDAADALEADEKRIAVLEDELLPKSGKWIQMNGHKYCSRCGHKDSPIFTHYCPNCGAKMKGEQE